MTSRQLHSVSWLVGIVGLAAVVWYVQPTEFLERLRSVGAQSVLTWLALLFAARLVMTEITVLPIRALGLSISRSEAFWIGWIRTFSNQIFPFSGLAYYAHRLRRSSGISWAQLAALSSTQLLLAAAGVGLIGAVAAVVNVSGVGESAWLILIVFTVMASASLLVAVWPEQIIERLPGLIRRHAGVLVEAAGRLAKYPKLVLTMTLVYCVTLLLHGARLWVLFLAVGIQLSWQETLLLLAIAESAGLFQVTPGGLGLREGAIVGAAMLLLISVEAAATVALLDRLFMMAITTLLAAPAAAQIYRSTGTNTVGSDQ